MATGQDARDLARQIGAMAPGTTVKLTVWRKGEEKTFSVALGELPNERDARATSSDSATPRQRCAAAWTYPRSGR